MLAGQVLTGCGGESPTETKTPSAGGNTAPDNMSFYATGELGGDVSINKDKTEAKVRVNGNDVCYTAGDVDYYIDQTNNAISVVIGGEGISRVVREPKDIVPTGILLAENLYGTQADLYKVLSSCPKGGEVLFENGAPVSPYTEIPESKPATVTTTTTAPTTTTTLPKPACGADTVAPGTCNKPGDIIIDMTGDGVDDCFRGSTGTTHQFCPKI